MKKISNSNISTCNKTFFREHGIMNCICPVAIFRSLWINAHHRNCTVVQTNMKPEKLLLLSEICLYEPNISRQVTKIGLTECDRKLLGRYNIPKRPLELK